jgi:uncharacterized membrane protein YgcG
MTLTHNAKTKNSRQTKNQARPWTTTLLTGLGLTGLVTGCTNADLALTSDVNAQTLPAVIPNSDSLAASIAMPSPTSIPVPIFPTATPTWTPLPTSTPWPTPTSWPTPQSWQPAQLTLPTLTSVPLVPARPGMPSGSMPVGYLPPDGVDVFGSTILRWAYYGELAPDEYFDIKIKPFGSNNSAFVDWTKSTEYALQPWSGWKSGLYHWQIGIIKGYLDENGTKHFIADTGRDSELFLIKWQPASGGGSGSNSGGGSSNSGSSSGGGGNSSGGS